MSEEIREVIHDEHLGFPQRQAHALLAFDEAVAAIGRLRGFGHRLQIVWETPPEPVEFPKMMYHDDEEPVVVENAREEGEREDAGWRSTL